VPQQLEDLKLSEAQAEAVIEKAIEYEAYGDPMPDTKKEKLAAADEIVAFAIDAYVNDDITSDDDDPEVARSGEQIEELMELAGVSIDDGEPVFGDAPEAEGEDEDGDDEPEGEGEEGPFDPDDYIEGYTDMSVALKLKTLKKLDADDDEDAGLLEDIADWENEQDKPNSRVLHYIDETLGEPEDAEADADEDEDADDADEPEAEGDEDGEPWEGYDKATAAQIKQVLTDAAADEDEPLSREQVEYVLDYEQSREKPPPRKRIIDFCTALIEQFDNGDDGDDEPEPEPKRGRGRAKKAAKAEDDGMLMISLNGEELGEFDASAVLAVIANLTEQIEGGATSLALDLS
jgi:hypothetical protein